MHAVPDAPDAQTASLAPWAIATPAPRIAVDQFSSELGRHQTTVRSIHERLYFRPLLEAFAALAARVAAAPGQPRRGSRRSASPTRTARGTRSRELTSGLTRSSRLMQQMLPLLLDWLVGLTRSRLGPALPAQPRVGCATLDRARRRCSATRPRRPAGCACSSARAAMVADAVLHNPDLVARAPRLRAAAHEPQARLWSTAPARRWRGARTSRSARPGCGAGRSATSSASRRATCSARPTSRRSAAT